MSFFGTIYAEQLPSRAVLVYMYLKDRADKQNKCFPSYRRIASDVGLSRNTVIRAVKDLKTKGILVTEQRYRNNGAKSSLLYTLKSSDY